MLLKSAGGRMFHWCPACETVHPIPPHGWTLSGTPERPTFTPSFKHTFYLPSQKAEVVCHFNLTDGKIEFHRDSWHKRSDIVAMMPIPPEQLKRLDEVFSEE
jgi:hypothetical protein